MGKRFVLGVRPEDLSDAALAPDTPAGRRLRGRLLLREALGSEVDAHVEIAARPVYTEDTRELAEDTGTGPVNAAREGGRDEKSTFVGRFSPRSQVREGEPVELAVDTTTLHFFDIDTGLGIYDGSTVKSIGGERAGSGGDSSPDREDHDEHTETLDAASA